MDSEDFPNIKKSKWKYSQYKTIYSSSNESQFLNTLEIFLYCGY